MSSSRKNFTAKSRQLIGKSLRPKLKKQQSEDLTKIITQKFMKFISDQRLNFLKTKLSEFYGKNFTINYKNQYNFSEQWQTKNTQQQKTDFEFMGEQNPISILLSLLFMITYSLTIWFRNIQLFFASQLEERISWTICFLAILCQMLDLAVLSFGKFKNTHLENKLIDFIQSAYKNIICIVFLVLNLMHLDHHVTIAWILFQFFSLYLFYCRARQIYQSFRLLNIALIYQYQFKVFDLILSLIMIAHVFSIILFLSTQLGYDITWVTVLGIQNQTQYVKYLYSFYFCTTTILTVGYGDITPRNRAEVAIVSLIQIFGIVMFAYLINQIGYSLSAMRNSREVVQKDLSTMSKMKKYYKIDNNLMGRARNYLIHHKPQINQLTPAEESQVLVKFNEQLRNQITTKNSISVIKSCIFFLCRWSKAIQFSISNNLEHILFSPGQYIYQPEGKQKIYIIRQGKIDIYTERKGGKKQMKNIIKSIDVNLQKCVSDNCYGYTAVISRRTVRFHAISKDFSSSYYIQKQKFIQCVNERAQDYQYYHEIKSKIDQSLCWESLQVPKLENSKHHYNPTSINLIRKNKENQKQTNSRMELIRHKRVRLRGYKKALQSRHMERLRSLVMQSVEFIQSDEYTNNSSDFAIKEVRFNNQPTGHQQDQINEDDNCPSFDIKQNLHHYFESGKQYKNFFPKNNKTEVLRKQSIEYFMPQKIQKQMKSHLSFRANIQFE